MGAVAGGSIVVAVAVVVGAVVLRLLMLAVRLGEWIGW